MFEGIKWAHRQRLQFIELSVYYVGFISRRQLARRFTLSDAAATKDIRLYQKLAPGNLVYRHGRFGYVPGPAFRAVFADLSPGSVLSRCEDGLFGGFVPDEAFPYPLPALSLESPVRLPEQAVLAQLTRAICQRRKLSLHYHSLSSGGDSRAVRVIEPHTLVNTGLRWHARAYNVQTFDFRDFVLSRISEARCLEQPAESSADYDEDWSERIALCLVPHPGLNSAQRQAVLLDYAADASGEVVISTRRALAAYLLQRMGVDTTPEHSRSPQQCPLALRNRDELETFASWAL